MLLCNHANSCLTNGHGGHLLENKVRKQRREDDLTHDLWVSCSRARVGTCDGCMFEISTMLATTLVQVLCEVLICCCHSPLLEERRALPINKSNRTTIKIHHCHANVSNELAQCSLLPTQCMSGPFKMNISTMLNNTSSKLAKAIKQLQRQVSRLGQLLSELCPIAVCIEVLPLAPRATRKASPQINTWVFTNEVLQVRRGTLIL